MIETAVEKRLLTVDDYYKMAEFGILKPDERVELINGEIIKMSPVNSRYAGHVRLMNRTLNFLIGTEAIISIQNPIRLNDKSEPEPDIAVLYPREDSYIESHPTADDIILLIEVSDSTLRYDRVQKAELYATENIQEYWIVNLQNKQLEVYQNPLDGKYTTKAILKKGEKVKIPNTDIEIEVSAIIK